MGTNLSMYFGEVVNAMGWGVLFAYLTDFIAVDKAFGTPGATTGETLDATPSAWCRKKQVLIG